MRAIWSAPRQSIFVFQVCCHNPTGQDYSHDQWVRIADGLQAKAHFVFFDIAYQGLASDMDTDAWPVRYFAARGLGILACQSFSKHMALYSERVGVLHVVCPSAKIAINVRDQLRSLIRWEVSSTPAYGARLADITMSADYSLYDSWLVEVQQACERLKEIRLTLYDLLQRKYKVPGTWDHIMQETGLFSYMNLTAGQIRRLREEHHIHIAQSGRVNIAGLNQGNVQRFVEAMKLVLCNSVKLMEASGHKGSNI